MKITIGKYVRNTSVREYRRLAGKHGRMGSMSQKGRKSVKMKKCPRNESFTGSVDARVRLMVRGGYLPIRGSKRMA